MASGVASRVGDAWESTREGVREGAQAVAHRAQDFWNDAANLIRRNPMQAMAIVFGAGCLVGCCLAAGWRSREADMTERMSRYSA
jgi:ElaB/YqjD/DUF883 family membrane-anchored ribosome-binding protein